MKNNKISLLLELLPDGISWLSQLLLVMGYFWVYANKGMPKIELIFIVHAAFVVYFIRDINSLKYRFPEKTKKYFIKMAGLVFQSFVALFIFIYVWDGLPKLT